MIICIGPICVPIWHLGVLALLIIRPLIDFLRRFCGSRDNGTVDDNTTTSTTSGTHKETSQGGGTVHRRRGENRVIPVKSQDEFDKVKAAAETEGLPLFVDFNATWCGPCRRIAPVFERLSYTYSGLFVSVDVDECYDLPDLPPALPTFRVYRPPQGVVDSLTGANEEKLKAMIARHAAPISSS